MKLFFITTIVLLSYYLQGQPTQDDEIFEGYYSNYFSFHGEDELGEIYFAIDNNRQRTQKRHEADNFLYFSVDGEWQELNAHQKFENTETDMSIIPSSDHFQFQYTDQELSAINSPTNDIKVTLTEPLQKVGEYGGNGTLFDIYSTTATLRHGDRTVHGNIISEVLIDSIGLKSISNFTKVIFGGFKFDAYYLNIRGLGDSYVHFVEGKASEGLFDEAIYNLNSQSGLTDFDITPDNYRVTKWKRLGFKKLPLEIEVDFPDAQLTLRTKQFQKYRSLPVFAFGMGTLEGELIYKGETYSVYGLSEVFTF